MRRLRDIEWEAVAGIVAAVLALVLHLLHVVETDVLLAVMLVLLALILLRGIRSEGREERTEAGLRSLATDLAGVRSALTPPDAVLVGPRALRAESERFAESARGEMVWFNVCLSMFVPQPIFDAMLRPAIENPLVARVRFVLDEGERAAWDEHVLPKIRACAGADKVLEPTWRELDETVSFVLAETDDGSTEGHLSFWGEPFMARSTGRDIPRYVFHVLGHSELIGRLVDLEREHTGRARPT